MKSRIFVVTTIGFVAAFGACNQSTTSKQPATPTTAVNPPPTYSPSAMDVATPTADGSEQIVEGAKLVGEGLREEARQAMAAGGAALERGGEQLQESVAAAAPQRTAPATQPPREPTTQPAPELPPQGRIAEGAAILKTKCASCHGTDASGDTAMGRKHGIPDLRSSGVQDLTDAELATAIANGTPGKLSARAHTSKALTADQIKDVIAYLRSIRT